MTMTTISKSILFVVAATATMASVVFANPVTKDDPGKIVGGDDAALGDYPYFVDMGRCGGALIAPDIVLTAAHCGSFEDQQVIVGGYVRYTLSEGSQARFCDTWKGDPKFRTGVGVNNYDFALCKLNEPVYLNSTVVLELNEFDAVPKEGKNLIVMGLGTTAEGLPGGSNILKDVTVPAISYEECSKEENYGNRVSDKMVCAGFIEEGGFDSCQGDSGGPIVRRKVDDDGTIVDTHVGIVSWGDGCARPNAPGVYARTSKNLIWIKSTMCQMGSIADICQDYPPPCEQNLTITLTTDRYGSETSWTLSDSENNRVMRRQYMVNNNRNEHKVCLRSNECYEFELLDTYGDGMCYSGNCGNYTFDINGEEILSEDGNSFTYLRTLEICTGDNPDCQDDESFEYNGNPERTCQGWVTESPKKRCKKEWEDGYVYDVCLQTCGDVGLGRCSKKR